MTVAPPYQADVEAIVATRRDNGADYWATPDLRLSTGGPFSTLEAPALLVELGVDPSEEVLRGAAELLMRAWREAGRFRLPRRARSTRVTAFQGLTIGTRSVAATASGYVTDTETADWTGPDLG